MVIEFRGRCEPDSLFRVNGGPGAVSQPMALQRALMCAIRLACLTGREIHLEQDARLAGRIVPEPHGPAPGATLGETAHYMRACTLAVGHETE